MPVAFTCPNPACARTSRLPDEVVGKRVKCPACGQTSAATIAPTSTADGTRPRMATAVSAAPVETVGRFVVRGKLGEGAFGAVYRAYDPQLDREVALKVPHAAVLDSPKRVERFLREAKAAANLRHPHVVPVFDAGSDGGRHYIASAFIDGQKLADAVEASDGGLEFARAARLVRELAEALAYAHEQGIVHRDVKPDNVMLDKADRVHLMDFGLAARQDAEARLTNDGAVMGTPSYMAPEQARGDTAAVGPAADQYACGVVLYELLTGKVPFTGPIPVVLHNQIHTDPEPPKKLRRMIPKDLEQVCLMALNKRPEERYASCRELADDLRRWQEGEPVSVRPLNSVEKVARWVRKNRVVAGLLGAVVIAVVVGLVTSTTFAVSADSHRRFAEQREAEARSSAELARMAEHATRKSASSLLLDRALGRFETQDNLAGYLNLAAALDQSEDTADTDRLIRRELAAWAAYTPKLESAHGRADDGSMNHWRFGVRGDGRQAAVGEESRIELVPLTADGPPARSLEHDGKVFAVTFSPDDRYLLVVMSVANTATDPGRVSVWDLKEPTAPPVVLGHARAVSRATFMPNGRVVTCAYDGVVRVWDLGRPDAPRHELKINGLVAELRPDADGKRMYIWERAGRLLVWEPGQPEKGVFDLKRPVGVGAVTPDGLTLACEAGFGIWLKTPAGEHTLPVVSGGVRSLALTEGGLTLFAATDDGVQVWDVSTRRRVCQLNPGLSDVKGVFVIRDDRVATVSRTIRQAGTTTLRVWKVRPEWTGRQVCATTSGIWSVSAGVGTDTVAWGSNGGRCELWDLGTNSRIGSGLSHGGSVTAVLLSPDERSVLTGSLDGKLRLWDTREDQRLVWEADSGGNPTSHPSKSVWAVAFGRDGKTAYFGGADFAIHSISVATGQPTRPPIPIGSQINAIAVGPNDAHLFVGCETPPPRRVQLEGEVHVKPLADISVAKSTAVTADGARCLFTTWGGHALVFDTATFRPLGLPMRHRSAIWRGVLSPDESLTATASTDATVRIWDTSSGRPIGPPIPHAAEVTSVAFTTGGRGLVSSTQTGKLLQFDLPPAVTYPGTNARRLAEIHTGAELLPDGGVRLLTADEWLQRRGDGEGTH